MQQKKSKNKQKQNTKQTKQRQYGRKKTIEMKFWI